MNEIVVGEGRRVVKYGRVPNMLSTVQSIRHREGERMKKVSRDLEDICSISSSIITFSQSNDRIGFSAVQIFAVLGVGNEEFPHLS